MNEIEIEDCQQAIFDCLIGGKTVCDIIKINGMPSRKKIYSWLVSDKNFKKRFDIAQELGFDHLAEETLGIVDEKPHIVNKDGKVTVDKTHVAWMSKRVDQRMKLLKHWYPSKYGDSIDVRGGGIGALNVTVATGVPCSSGQEDLDL